MLDYTCILRPIVTPGGSNQTRIFSMGTRVVGSGTLQCVVERFHRAQA
jgi:hypothetical protein